MVVVERLLLTLSLLTVLAATPAERIASPDPHRLPQRLALKPTAIERLDQPLEITVEGVAAKETLELQVLRDCDRDGQPGIEEEGECRSPLYTGTSAPAGKNAKLEDRLDFEQLAREGRVFPPGTVLWLRVRYPGSDKYLQRFFGFLEAPCTLFATVVDTFFPGRCGLTLPQVLREHRAPSSLADLLFEVRRVAVGAAPGEPATVPGTRGANGVAWIDGETLLVTAAGAPGTPELAPGLYRVGLDGKPPERLWAPTGDSRPAAPLALGRERHAFVLQIPGPRPSDSSPEMAPRLVVWERGHIEREVPLPLQVHQLLARDAAGQTLLALSLGEGDNRPALLTIDLRQGAVEEVGFDNALYLAALREPGGHRAVVAFENARQGGWELALAEPDGEGTETETKGKATELVARDSFNDLAPAWKPAGGEVAYLAEVEVKP